jgi:hypothetical protein
MVRVVVVYFRSCKSKAKGAAPPLSMKLYIAIKGFGIALVVRFSHYPRCPQKEQACLWPEKYPFNAPYCTAPAT